MMNMGSKDSLLLSGCSAGLSSSMTGAMLGLDFGYIFRLVAVSIVNGLGTGLYMVKNCPYQTCLVWHCKWGLDLDVNIN